MECSGGADFPTIFACILRRFGQKYDMRPVYIINFYVILVSRFKTLDTFTLGFWLKNLHT